MIHRLSTIFFVLITTALGVYAQTTPPAPGPARPLKVPPVGEVQLRNGLTVAVVERRDVPLVTIRLLIKSGADAETDDKAGLADMTASMLTKGTSTKTATEIAEAVEFLGGSIASGANWNGSFLSLTVTSDKVDQAVAIMSDLVLHPKFDAKELDLLRSQTLDGLTYNLKQPSFIANFVGSKFSFSEHPAGGTPASITSITTSDVVAFHNANYKPTNAVLIFTGDISAKSASALADKAFSSWGGKINPEKKLVDAPSLLETAKPNQTPRLLVIDLPNAGQAAVNYYRAVPNIGRSSTSYYPAIVLNSVLGGGYSSRLNYEIRIKRGLSYGAGSSFGWRDRSSNFSAGTQTKNVSAAEVAELTLAELKKLETASVPETELVPRRSVLTGTFGRNLETTAGLAAALSDLYSFGIPADTLNSYITSVNDVQGDKVQSFASASLSGGDIIIVGDYAVFKDDLAKRFPDTKIEVVKAADLDITKPGLHK